jgi:hypothetical protein
MYSIELFNKLIHCIFVSNRIPNSIASPPLLNIFNGESYYFKNIEDKSPLILISIGSTNGVYQFYYNKI